MQLTSKQIESWVKRNFQYKIASGGRQIRINNPFDINDSKYHLWIALEEAELTKGPLKGTKGFWVYDFRGKYASSFINFVKRYLHVEKVEAYKSVVGTKIDPSVYLQEEESDDEPEQILELPPGSKPITGSEDCMARNIAVSYLKGRGITSEHIDKYSIHYTVSSVVFPYFEYGNIVYWQERNIMNKVFAFPDAAKTGTKKTDFLYGFDFIMPESVVYVAESIFNAISLGEDCLASGGAILAGKQIERLRMLRPKKVVLVPDNDEAGIKSLVKNYYQLSEICPIWYSIPPGDDDWNDIEQKSGGARDVMLNLVKRVNLLSIIGFQTKLAKLRK